MPEHSFSEHTSVNPKRLRSDWDPAFLKLLEDKGSEASALLEDEPAPGEIGAHRRDFPMGDATVWGHQASAVVLRTADKLPHGRLRRNQARSG